MLDPGSLRPIAILLVMTLAALGPRAGACPGSVAAMDCCAGEADDASPRLERACCCVEVPDEKQGRPADLTGVRPAHDASVELAWAAESGLVPWAVARDPLPPPRPTPRPPPTLLEARTSFRC